MKIGILETGHPPAELCEHHGTYPDMVEHLLKAKGKAIEFETFNVTDDIFPDSPYTCDAWVITGSRHGVYENLPWMLRLQDLIRETVSAKQPLVGICFGHQIVATALGGRVVKSEKGWGIGPQTYTISDNFKLAKGVKQVTINAIHQDQVVEKPKGAEVIASSEFCPYAGFLYGDTVLTVQPHPEFSIAFETDLLKLRKGDVIPQEVVDPALEKLESGQARIDSSLVGQWMLKFLSQ